MRQLFSKLKALGLTSWIWAFLSGLFLTACAATAISSSPTLTRTPPLLSTLTQTPLQKRTRIPTKPLSTLLPSPVTPQPTLPPLKRLSPEDSAGKFLELLIDNGGCRLPCFWGVTPGKTSFSELYQFMSQFTSAVSGEAPIAINNDSRGRSYTLDYAHYESGEVTFGVQFFEEDSIIQAIRIDQDTTRLSFPLTRLFGEYGKPDEILIGRSDSFYQNSEYFYQLIIVYEDQRIAGSDLLYTRENGTYICYDPQTGIEIVTWAQGKNWFDYSDHPKTRLRPLEQVTDYDLDSFYEQFSTKNRSICMKTLEVNP